jgi:uncharacterized membrane protein YkoI
MTMRTFLTFALVVATAGSAHAQPARSYFSSGGEVSKASAAGDLARLAPHIPGLSPELRARLRISGDSAQRIALHDFDWRGRVSSIEVDGDDARAFWDVKIVPDSTIGTIVRYRVDGKTGGILEIREFTGVRGLARKRP